MTMTAHQAQPTQNHHYVVVDDPTHEYWEGSLIDSTRARALVARGVVLLPVEPRLFSSGVGGYHRRAWGAGYPLDYTVPRMCAPLTLFCVKDYSVLHWAARLVLSDELVERVKAGGRVEGMLRFTADTGQPMPQYATYSPSDKPQMLAGLKSIDDRNGWVIRGSGRINIPGDSHYGFALYGTAPGVRVAWAAASLAQF